MFRPIRFRNLLSLVLAFALVAAAHAQGTSGSVSGTITDQTSALVPGATVVILNSVSGYTRTTKADANGQYHFYNVPFNPYRLTVTNAGFQKTSITIDINSVVPVVSLVKLDIESSNTTVDVVDTGTDLVENDSTFHTDIDRSTIDKLPLESASSSLSSLVTLSSPGVSADSNGLSTASATTLKTRFPSMASPSRTSRARCSPISSPPTPSSRSK